MTDETKNQIISALQVMQQSCGFIEYGLRSNALSNEQILELAARADSANTSAQQIITEALSE